MAAPMRESQSTLFSSYFQLKTILLLVFCILVIVRTKEIELLNSILCKQCGHSISKGEDLNKVISDLSLRQRNDSLFGHEEVFIQLFRNPDNKYFEVITTKSAKVTLVNQAERKHSWFPGFSWQVAVCPDCGFHLGWLFRPLESAYDSSRMFYGLILNHITHNLFTDSLLIVPRSYRGA